MSRTLHIALAAAVSAFTLAFAAAAAAPGRPAPKTVQGTVGPGFTINLTLGGKKLTTLKIGVRYRLVIDDRSSIHDFHLMGPGLNRVLTTLGFTGTKSIVLTLKEGASTASSATRTPTRCMGVSASPDVIEPARRAWRAGSTRNRSATIAPPSGLASPML